MAPGDRPSDTTKDWGSDPRFPPSVVERLALASEDALAARVADERRRRGWSQQDLASKVEEILGGGFPQSAVSKIEKANGRRAITVDEALAFCKVFDIALEELLLPRRLAASRQAMETLRLAQDHHGFARSIDDSCAEAIDALRLILADDPDLAQEMRTTYGRSRQGVAALLFGDDAPRPQDSVRKQRAVTRVRRLLGLPTDHEKESDR